MIESAPAMDEGILDVKLVPAWNSPGIRPLLQRSLFESQLLQAGIAYWTVNDGMFGSSLARTLAHESGFLCVDLHQPTDVDALAVLVAKKCHVYLYCEDITTYSDGGQKEPPYLVHTKMLLFWSVDRTAELWVGSHNWTNRAILGLNVESSLVIKLRDSSSLFCEAVEYLRQIKQISEEFELSKVDFYKQLQRNISQKTTPVIELEGKNADSLGNVTIGLFGTDAEDLKELGTVRRDVYVSVFDTDSGEEYLYPATIVHSGLLSASHPAGGGISFEPRRHAFRRGHRFPFLMPENEVAGDVMKNAEYFVTLSLERVDSSVVAEHVPARTASWERMDEQLSPLLRRLDTSTVKGCSMERVRDSRDLSV